MGILEEGAEILPAQRGSRICVRACNTGTGWLVHWWGQRTKNSKLQPTSGSQILAGYHLTPKGPAPTPRGQLPPTKYDL